MSNTLGAMVNLLLDDVVSNPNNIHTQSAKRYINQAYRTICESKRIEALVAVDELAVVDGACVLPSDCTPNSIESIIDSNGIQYYRDESRGRGGASYAYNYYMDSMADSLAECDSGAVAENDTTLTTQEDFFLEEHEGEYVAMGNNATLYRIETYVNSKEVELADGYRGEDETTAHLVVRPDPTYIIKFISDKNAALEPESITLTYQKPPLPLYNDYDVLLTPGSGDDVRFIAMQSMLRKFGKSREARMMSDEVRIERSLAAKDGSKKRYPFRATGFFRRPGAEDMVFGDIDGYK